MQEKSATKEKLFRDNCSKEFARKAKMQEERFTKKRDELNARIRELEQQKKRFDSRLQVAVEARKRAEQDLASLTQDMSEMQQQVGHVVELAEEARQSAEAARVVSRQRERMFLPW